MASEKTHDETAFDLPTSGIPAWKEQRAMMLGRDGKLLSGGNVECYATGRRDREAPKFPGVSGMLRGVANPREQR